MAEQRSSWGGGLTWLQKIALGLGIPASAAILYVLYRQYWEDQGERVCVCDCFSFGGAFLHVRSLGGLSSSSNSGEASGLPALVSSLVPPEERIPFVGEEEIEFVLKVPQEAVKFLLGRQGAKVNQASGRRGGWWAGDPLPPSWGPFWTSLRGFFPLLLPSQLRKDTHARINIDLEDSGEERLIRITGSPVQVCRAKAAIHQIMEESLPVAEKISVPNRAVGRIIGTSFSSEPLKAFLVGREGGCAAPAAAIKTGVFRQPTLETLRPRWDLEREGVALTMWPSLVVKRLQGHRKSSSLQTLLPSGPGDVP